MQYHSDSERILFTRFRRAIHTMQLCTMLTVGTHNSYKKVLRALHSAGTEGWFFPLSHRSCVVRICIYTQAYHA